MIMFSGELRHYGIPGMRPGIRRFQLENGTLTPEGKIRYGVGSKFGPRSYKKNDTGLLGDEYKVRLGKNGRKVNLAKVKTQLDKNRSMGARLSRGPGRKLYDPNYDTSGVYKSSVSRKWRSRDYDDGVDNGSLGDRYKVKRSQRSLKVNFNKGKTYLDKTKKVSFLSKKFNRPSKSVDSESVRKGKRLLKRLFG